MAGPATGVAEASRRPAASAQQAPGWWARACTAPAARGLRPRTSSTCSSARAMPIANQVRKAGSHWVGLPPVEEPTRAAPSRCHHTETTVIARRPVQMRRVEVGPRPVRPRSRSISRGSRR
ncbi:hypothetical protein GCM10009562_25650 [Nocardioides aquaticus]